ncbi:MAG TPA: hypothetical protein VF831_08410 [Anaerolineales bacterium]
MSQTSDQLPHSQRGDQLELLWNDLLSRQPERIKSAFTSLDTPSRKSVLIHLQHMANDSGWQPEQRLSALAAIQALQDYSHQVEE